jgi:hypothetical protein
MASSEQQVSKLRDENLPLIQNTTTDENFKNVEIAVPSTLHFLK